MIPRRHQNQSNLLLTKGIIIFSFLLFVFISLSTRCMQFICELFLFTCRAKKANTDNVSGSERRKGFGSKGSAEKNWKMKHNLKKTSENSVKSGKGNLKFQPQAESKAGETKKRKRNGGSEQQSYNKKQKDFRKTKLDNSSDNKQRSFRKNKKNTPAK